MTQYKIILNPTELDLYAIEERAKIIKKNEELEKELREKDNILRITTNKLIKARKKSRYKLEYISNQDLEKTADECRFSSGKLNLTKLGTKFGVDPDTIKNEISRRNLKHLLNPLKK